ncbi:hypothetical protein [Trichloromonas sp.]|uniref:hypothetical protein n=1 Tax=Trichloromonas sp. TaxID=3069249 RepID=UPI002A4299B3|nr:hypothetical protein [Trichloromonas sp.]
MDKKHPCPDCKMCQWCSDDRCRQCLRTGCKKKLSMAEQIELFERMNRTCEHPPEN